MINHPAAAPPSARPISNSPMTTTTAITVEPTATTVEPPSPAAAEEAVRPDPQERLGDLTANYMFAVVFLFGIFVITAACGPMSKSLAGLAVAAVMLFYSMAVSLPVLRYWDKKQNNELAAGSGCKIMVRLSLLTGMTSISLAIMALLLRPDWHDIAFVVAVSFCATAFLLGFVHEEDRREMAPKMRSRAACPQEKTLDHV